MATKQQQIEKLQGDLRAQERALDCASQRATGHMATIEQHEATIKALRDARKEDGTSIQFLKGRIAELERDLARCEGWIDRVLNEETVRLGIGTQPQFAAPQPIPPRPAGPTLSGPVENGVDRSYGQPAPKPWYAR